MLAIYRDPSSKTFPFPINEAKLKRGEMKKSAKSIFMPISLSIKREFNIPGRGPSLVEKDIPIVSQTPRVRIPFGASYWHQFPVGSEPSGEFRTIDGELDPDLAKKNFQTSFTLDENEKSQAAYKYDLDIFMTAIKNMIKREKADLFPQTVTDTQIDCYFESPIRVGKVRDDGTCWPSSFDRIKLYTSGPRCTQFFMLPLNKSVKPIHKDLSILRKSTRASMQFRFLGLSFSKNLIRPVIYAEQVYVQEQESTPTMCTYVDTAYDAIPDPRTTVKNNKVWKPDGVDVYSGNMNSGSYTYYSAPPPNSTHASSEEKVETPNKKRSAPETNPELSPKKAKVPEKPIIV